MTHRDDGKPAIVFQDNRPNLSTVVSKSYKIWRFLSKKSKFHDWLTSILGLGLIGGNGQPPIVYQENQPNFGPPVSKKLTKIEVSDK